MQSMMTPKIAHILHLVTFLISLQPTNAQSYNSPNYQDSGPVIAGRDVPSTASIIKRADLSCPADDGKLLTNAAGDIYQLACDTNTASSTLLTSRLSTGLNDCATYCSTYNVDHNNQCKAAVLLQGRCYLKATADQSPGPGVQSLVFIRKSVSFREDPNSSSTFSTVALPAATAFRSSYGLVCPVIDGKPFTVTTNGRRFTAHCGRDGKGYGHIQTLTTINDLACVRSCDARADCVAAISIPRAQECILGSATSGGHLFPRDASRNTFVTS